LLGKIDADYTERLLNGRVLLSTRAGIFQLRLYLGDGKYIYKSLKTRELMVARDRAMRAFYEFEFRKEQNLPLQQMRFGEVLTAYEQMRAAQNARGTYNQRNKQNLQQTSDHMLRQIQRVNRFWHAYCGHMLLEKVDNAVLRDYVLWRLEYYSRMPALKRPRNHSLNPSDKTLEWETTYALTVLKWATERGYRGQMPMPSFRHKAQRITTRPCFSIAEYAKLYQQLRTDIANAVSKAEQHRYTHELLRDYVLILANSGMRVGEANALRETDLVEIEDDTGRKLYGFNVMGKTGKRFVVLRASARRSVDRCLARNAQWRAQWQLSAKAKQKTHNRKRAEHDNWLFRMADGNKIITLIDQFNAVLKRANITYNAEGEKFTLYSLRHFYAVQMLRKGKVNAFDVARNMGTSVQIIESYYGKHATSRVLATRLGS
jgi:integrase